MTDLRAVVFDWRGTLVTTLAAEAWIGEALALLGRERDADSVAHVLSAISHADGEPSRLEAGGVDCDARRHRDTYYAVFSDAGLDDDLSDALYAVESDPSHNHFADDVAETLRWLTNRGCRVAILSDIHFDLRPAFVAAGVDRFVDGYVLSFECGVQKPDSAIFRAALDALGSSPAEPGWPLARWPTDVHHLSGVRAQQVVVVVDFRPDRGESSADLQRRRGRDCRAADGTQEVRGGFRGAPHAALVDVQRHADGGGDIADAHDGAAVQASAKRGQLVSGRQDGLHPFGRQQRETNAQRRR